jgi:hypothetical protein
VRHESGRRDHDGGRNWHVAANPLAPRAQEPKRFEYRIVEVLPDTTNMQTKLNEFGMNGWELVSVSMGNMTEPRLIFKK